MELLKKIDNIANGVNNLERRTVSTNSSDKKDAGTYKVIK